MIDFGHPKGVQSTVFVPLSLLTALFVIPLVARDLLQHFNLYGKPGSGLAITHFKEEAAGRKVWKRGQARFSPTLDLRFIDAPEISSLAHFPVRAQLRANGINQCVPNE